MLSFGDFGSEKRILNAAEQFSSYVKLMQQEAIIKNETLGMFIDNKGYRAMHLINQNWQKVSLSHLQFKTFPEQTKITLIQDIYTESSEPQLKINANGDFTPFQIKFSSKKNPNIINVIGKNDDTIILQ